MGGILERIRGFVDSTDCRYETVVSEQSETESAMEYTQRHAQTFMLYGGYETTSISGVLGRRAPVSQ